MRKTLKHISAIALALLIGLSSIGFGTVYGARAVAAPERFSEGEWPDILWGLRDSNGNIIVPAMYRMIFPFSEGLAAMSVWNPDSGWWGAEYFGFIDTAGRVIVPPIYQDVGNFSDGRAAVRLNNRWGFIDRDGNIAIPIQFDMVSGFSGGFAGVGQGTNPWEGQWGLINTNGELIVPMAHSREDITLAMNVLALPAGLVPANVEQLHWNEVQQVLPLRTPIRILDIGTGIYFYVSSMSNGNHADVEPVTATDTALLMEAFGGVETWGGRPVWVTVGNRTFSASIHSMPHAQSTIAGNNMDGHVCLHFYGSTTHNTNLPTYHYVILQAQRAFDAFNQVAAGIAGVGAPAPQPSPTPAPVPAYAPATPAPEVVMALPTEASVFIDGVAVNFQAFHIGGHNFFRLRDLAFALNGTAARFNLGWDGVSQAISIYRGAVYVPVGGEMSAGSGEIRPATPTQADIFLDGVRISPRAYHINGNNFFMLAELAEALGFTATWDGSARAILISTIVDRC